MKLEVGMYARKGSFGIGKLIQIYKDSISHWWGGNCKCELKYVLQSHNMICELKRKNIEKASYNLIDLIEVGDYVNGELVTDITGEYIRIGNVSHNKSWLKNNIKTILTKEQFEDNCFRTGDK